ncbi:MAG: zinc metalloprotease [Acidobacteriota bacterium]|nr:zinc metalloprotease [Acidobacteriota bacterium]
MKRNLITLLVAVLISNLAASLAFAQEADFPSKKHDIFDEAEPFFINGRAFKNKEEFIESGARCRTKEPSEAQSQNIYEQLERVRASRIIMDAAGVAEYGEEGMRQSGSITINVRWHVINRGEGVANGDVTQQMIEDQVAVLNQAFSGQAGGFNTPFRFVLQSVSRTTNTAWFQNTEDNEFEMKQALRQGDFRTLNIYSAGMTDGTLGWAYVPEEVQNYLVYDGVVILHTTLPGGSEAPYNLGDTLTHEIGHWLGLYHTFRGGCNKSTGGDYIWDTPAERSSAYGCPSNRRSCPRSGGYDPTTNFMDYTDDACMFKFTAGQAQRMDLAAEVYRGL